MWLLNIRDVHVVLVRLFCWDQLSSQFLFIFWSGCFSLPLALFRDFLFIKSPLVLLTLKDYQIILILFSLIYSVKLTIEMSMWFWSVSWPINCPVNFSIFLVDQKENCPVKKRINQGNKN